MRDEPSSVVCRPSSIVSDVNMYGFVLTVHIIVSAGLILIVLLQAGKGAGISGLFGGGSDAGLGGPSTPAVIKKITTTMAVLFMITALALTVIVSKSKKRSLAETIPVAPAKKQSAPVSETQPSPEAPVAPTQP